MIERLKKRLYWRNFVGMKDAYEGDKFKGSFPQYSELFSARMNISANRGSAEAEAFGTLLEYDRVAVTRDVNVDMNENSIVWLDDANTEGAHNYIVLRRSVSGNYAVFALKRVEVSL